MQAWSREEIAASFGNTSASYCTTALPGLSHLAARQPTNVAPFQYTDAGGGYLTPTDAAAIPSTCDFDVVDETGGDFLSTAEFQHVYVSARRPVLVRGAQRGARWDALRERWNKANLGLTHQDVVWFFNGLCPCSHVSSFLFCHLHRHLYLYCFCACFCVFLCGTCSNCASSVGILERI